MFPAIPESLTPESFAALAPLAQLARCDVAGALGPAAHAGLACLRALRDGLPADPGLRAIAAGAVVVVPWAAGKIRWLWEAVDDAAEAIADLRSAAKLDAVIGLRTYAEARATRERAGHGPGAGRRSRPCREVVRPGWAKRGAGKGGTRRAG